MTVTLGKLCTICDFELKDSGATGLKTTGLASKYEAERHEISVAGQKIHVRGSSRKNQY